MSSWQTAATQWASRLGQYGAKQVETQPLLSGFANFYKPLAPLRFL
jgi:hypothetical protein